MIFEAGRDTAAMFALDALLSQAREELIQQELSGQPPDENYWPDREAAAREEVKQRFYNPTVQAAVKPGEGDAASGAPGPGDDEASTRGTDTAGDQDAYDDHGQKLVEHAIWMTHAIIKQIPFVGQERFGKD